MRDAPLALLRASLMPLRMRPSETDVRLGVRRAPVSLRRASRSKAGQRDRIETSIRLEQRLTPKQIAGTKCALA